MSGLAARLSADSAERVERLRQLYEAGQYSVSSADIAGSIVDEHKTD